MSASLIKLLELINRDNGTLHALEDDLSFGVPEVNDSGNGRDTKITIASANPSKYTGEVVAYYNRLSIPLLFKNISPVLQKSVIPAEATTARDLVSLINAKYGTTFEPEDIVTTPFTLDNPPVDLSFTATAESLAYKGSTVVVLAADGKPLPDVFPVTLLSGLDYPNNDITKGQASIYSYRLAAINNDAVAVAGYTVGDMATESLRQLLVKLSGDAWVINGNAGDFNLSAATVVYNGLVSARPAAVPNNANYTNVLVVQLGALCNNFGGLLTIWY